MKKRIVDLTPSELNDAANDAWRAAAEAALAKGLSITGSRDGRRFRYGPDGKVEDLGPVETRSEGDQQSVSGTPSGRRSA